MRYPLQSEPLEWKWVVFKAGLVISNEVFIRRKLLLIWVEINNGDALNHWDGTQSLSIHDIQHWFGLTIVTKKNVVQLHMRDLKKMHWFALPVLNSVLSLHNLIVDSRCVNQSQKQNNVIVIGDKMVSNFIVTAVKFSHSSHYNLN